MVKVRSAILTTFSLTTGVIAILVAIQDLFGCFLIKSRELTLTEHSGVVSRFSLSKRDEWLPSRLERAAKVIESGGMLERMSSRRWLEHPGTYVMTEKNLWLIPRHSSSATVTIVAPKLIPWWMRLIVYGLPLGACAFAYRRDGERELWIQWLRRVKEAASASLNQDSLQQSVVSKVLLCIIAILLVVLHSSPGRPIWTDEFLHYALGSYSSTSEAWSVVEPSLVSVNHGQTGLYMMIDYWLLKGFGASAWALRLPSLVATLVMLLASAALLRTRGYGTVWQATVMIALGCNSWLMAYAAEARPYMPLAATAAGTLVYYFSPVHHRSRWGLMAWGWGSVFIGVANHPYFVLYWFAAYVLSYLMTLSERSVKPSPREILAHSNLPLSICGTLVFALVGSLSWMRGGPSFNYDPFTLFGADQFVWDVIRYHFDFLEFVPFRYAWLGLVMAATLGWLVVPKLRSQQWRPLIVPAALVVCAFCLTFVLSYMSYRRHYLIGPRQWLGSFAFAAIGSAWLWLTIARQLSVWRPLVGVGFAIALPLLLTDPLWRTVADYDQTLLRNQRLQRQVATVPEPSDAAFPGEIPTQSWVDLANANVRSGGPVWRYFRHYYAQESTQHPDFEAGAQRARDARRH